jgi:hypothetical protein
MTTSSSPVLLLTMSAEPFINCEGLSSLIRRIDQIVASASSPVMAVIHTCDAGYSDTVHAIS